jgi:[ribosomal protein S5]-alanine N-acetyltransferase
VTLHPSFSASTAPAVRLYGRRVMLRPLVAPDFAAWSEVRLHNEPWLVPWEPLRPATMPDPARSRDAFASRCSNRDKDRQFGNAYQFGLFIGSSLIGEVNINSVQRGPLQSGTIGYWIDQRHAGRGYVPEAVVVLMHYAFEEIRLHRLEICIVPRNHRSISVVDKLSIRCEGVALRYLEINGLWEDHARYAITVEEWAHRRDGLLQEWGGR